MSFPYGMIVAANMLANNKGERQYNAPKIETLGEYTQLTSQQFYDLLTARAKSAGICEMADMITNWQGFDNLTDKQKFRFVTQTINPQYYSVVNRLKRLLK